MADLAPPRSIVSGDTFWDLLTERARRTPDNTMFVDDRRRRFSFADIRAWAERVAAGLHDLGITEGTRVTWQLPTWAETVVVSLALSRLGAIQNPVIQLYREREVGSLLRSTKAEWYIGPRVWKGFDFEAMATQLVSGLPHECRILTIDGPPPEGDPDTLPPAPADGDAVRWIYATSGTTAEPKAAMHTDKTLIAGGTGLGHAYQLTEADLCVIVFPYAHIGGPDQLVISLRYGPGNILFESFAISEAVVLMNEFGATVSGGSTAFYLMFLAEQAKNPDVALVPTLKYLNGGGAPKPPEIYWRAKRELGVRIFHGFGMTEVPSMASGGILDTDEQLANTDGGAVLGAELEVRGADDRTVPPGTEGDIVVRGPQVCVGYTDPSLNAESFDTQGFFRTGDRGYMRPDGHIVITGRTKDIIIRKGENISAKEIEDVLQAHPKVGAVAVIGLPDPDRGERVCAVVETRPGAEPITFLEVQQACAEAGLMRQKHPEQLEIIDAMPRNPTMKILKHELRARFRT